MNAKMRSDRLSGRGRRMKAAAVGSLAVSATLLLGVTPAQADSGLGGWIAPAPTPDLAPGPDPLDDPEKRADFLSRCGEWCTIVNGEFTGDPREGVPENMSGMHDNCTSPASFTYKEEETQGNGIVIGLQLNSASVPVLPKIEYSSVHTRTEGVTDTVNQPPYTRSWLDKVPVTQKLRGTWKVAGFDPSNANVNEFTMRGPREFTDVEADATYTVLRKQSRPMTEEEKVTLCGNHSPS
ncbi:hypothetical protein [Streptomyces tubercidicus]